MSNERTLSWLDKLEEQLDVDVDWMDPEFIKSLPFKPHDQTSNQLWVDVQLGDKSNRELLHSTARELKDAGWRAIYIRLACLMCKNNLDLITGRVLLQTLPSNAYETDKIIQDAQDYDKEFERLNIGRDRYCIKIPATPPGLLAAKALSAIGIPTLGTAVFGVPQAVACSQAGCLYISPYLTEVRAHDDVKLQRFDRDPALEHPMYATIYDILEAYRILDQRAKASKDPEEAKKQQPLLKNASFVSVQEAMASGEMRCHSATLSPQTLKALASLNYHDGSLFGELAAKLQPYDYKQQAPSRLEPLGKSGRNIEGLDINYLEHEAAEVKKAIEDDPTVQSRLKDALELFGAAEERSKLKIELALKNI